MYDCRQLATRFSHIHCKHYYREVNRCTDGLATKGATQSADFLLFDSPPVNLETNFNYNFNGLYSIRCCTVSNEFILSTKKMLLAFRGLIYQ